MKNILSICFSGLAALVPCLSPAISLSDIQLNTSSPMALPPFTFVGRVSDYDHVAFDGDQLAEVRAYTTNGTLIAKSSTFAVQSSAYNFRLDVPVATMSKEGYVMPNTKIKLEFVDDSGNIYDGVVPEDNAVVGLPGGTMKIFTLLATDADNNGIADEKEYYYMMYARYLGLDNWWTFDAAADYDGDGQCNRDEYIAGTNPYLAEDVFNVSTLNVDFWPKDEDGTQLYDWVKVGFFANNGRCYSLMTSPSLDDGNVWRRGEFLYHTSDTETYPWLVTNGEEAGWRWFYIQKDTDRRFWRIEVE